MTSEVAVWNSQAIALAADSAITSEGPGGPKIFSSADKIFALSQHEPMAAMFHGDASINGVPWETVVKYFRAQQGHVPHATVREQAYDFLRFLAADDVLFASSDEAEWVLLQAVRFFERLRVTIAVQLENEDSPRRAASPTSRQRSAQSHLRELLEAFEAQPRRDLPTDFERRVRSTYEPVIRDAISFVFEDAEPKLATRTGTQRLENLFITKLLAKGSASGSGLVVAGFGRREVFPQFLELTIDGVLLGSVIYDETEPASIGLAGVRGFAQADIIHLFMEGVTPQYENAVEEYVADLLRDQETELSASPKSRSRKDELAAEALRTDRIETMRFDLARHRREMSIDPVLEVVNTLPKDELGLMAESLVTLTSLKRRISLDNETVGGPVDVAIMTKGDGLIWMKRKNYFDPALNPDFATRPFSLREQPGQS